MPDDPQLPAVTPEQIEQGKALALLSWISLFLGVPLWIVPMVQRDNAFALYHAKHAGMTFLAGLVIGVVFVIIYVITCGLGILLLPVFLLTLIPTIDGLVKASGGRMEPPMFIGPLTDSLFGGLTVDPDKVKTDDPPPVP